MLVGVVGRIAVIVDGLVTGGGVAVTMPVVGRPVVVGVGRLGLVVVEVVLVVVGLVPVVVDAEGDTRATGGCTMTVPFVGAEVVLLNKVTS